MSLSYCATCEGRAINSPCPSCNPQPTECHCAEGMPACDYCLLSEVICKGCDRIEDDDDYGRDEDCGECFIDGAPQSREQVTAGWSPLPVWMNTHDERNPE